MRRRSASTTKPGMGVRSQVVVAFPHFVVAILPEPAASLDQVIDRLRAGSHNDRSHGGPRSIGVNALYG
jgi:hypothetical protein